MDHFAKVRARNLRKSEGQADRRRRAIIMRLERNGHINTQTGLKELPLRNFYPIINPNSAQSPLQQTFDAHLQIHSDIQACHLRGWLTIRDVKGKAISKGDRQYYDLKGSECIQQTNRVGRKLGEGKSGLPLTGKMRMIPDITVHDGGGASITLDCHGQSVKMGKFQAQVIRYILAKREDKLNRTRKNRANQSNHVEISRTDLRIKNRPPKNMDKLAHDIRKILIQLVEDAGYPPEYYTKIKKDLTVEVETIKFDPSCIRFTHKNTN